MGRDIFYELWMTFLQLACVKTVFCLILLRYTRRIVKKQILIFTLTQLFIVLFLLIVTKDRVFDLENHIKEN